MENKTTFTCMNPATSEAIKTYPIMTQNEIRTCIERSRAAGKSFSTLTYDERATYILNTRQYILDHIDDIAAIISQNNGKPVIEAMTAEIYPVCDLMMVFAKQTKRMLKPERIPLGIWELLLRFSRIEYYPIGVIGIISPWNYPFSIPMGQSVMALMAGNTVVHKPSSQTAAIGEMMDRVFKASGLPDGVFTTVYGTGLSGSMVIEEGIDKLMFTGSVDVGKKVMEVAARHLIPVNLELGGKDPAIVLSDANLDVAVRGILWGAYTNAGQTCASVERVYVHESIYKPFVEKITKQMLQLCVGDPSNEDTDIGAMTSPDQRTLVSLHVAGASQKAANVISAEMNVNPKGNFYPPTILTNVDDRFPCVRDETFGPTLPIMSFKTDDEAVARANNSRFGLTASVWSTNITHARKIAHELYAGTVTINESVYTHGIAMTPWGGIKDSGFGHSHAKMGLKELVHARHIHTNYLPWLASFWWFPYSGKLKKQFKRVIPLLSGSTFSKILALPLLIQLILRKSKKS